MLHVFGADVLVTTTVGSGEILKAVLQQNKFGIGICMTAAHKKLVIDNLKTFVKNTNLVQFKGSPQKSAELIAYEQQLRGGRRDATSSADPPRADPPRADPPPAEREAKVVPPTVVQPPAGRGAANPKLSAFGTSIL